MFKKLSHFLPQSAWSKFQIAVFLAISATKMQATWRGFYRRKKFLHMKHSGMREKKLQRWVIVWFEVAVVVGGDLSVMCEKEHPQSLAGVERKMLVWYPVLPPSVCETLSKRSRLNSCSRSSPYRAVPACRCFLLTFIHCIILLRI